MLYFVQPTKIEYLHEFSDLLVNALSLPHIYGLAFRIIVPRLPGKVLTSASQPWHHRQSSFQAFYLEVI